jgi:hypothetical protein
MELKTVKEKISKLTLVQLAMIAGIVILAAMGKEGWGWLVFLTWCTL